MHGAKRVPKHPECAHRRKLREEATILIGLVDADGDLCKTEAHERDTRALEVSRTAAYAASCGAIFDCSMTVTEPLNDEVQGGLTDAQKRANVITLAFGGNEELFDEFCRTIEDVIPPGTTVVLRGSAVTGKRWKDQAPFDADGPGTSDLDLTLVGDGCLLFFSPTGFFVPGVHSRPLSDEDPDIAPDLVPLRRKLMEMVHRPVNIQASREIVIQFRGDLLGQPYLALLEKPEGLSLEERSTHI